MMESISEKFERDGYVQVGQVIDQQTVKALRAFLLSEFERKNTNFLPDAVLQYPQIFQLLQQPKLQQALSELLGSPFVVPPQTSAEHNRFGAFHTDTTGAEINNETFHKDPNFRMVTVAIYLQDNHQDYGGGIRLAPGTHRQPDRYVELTKRKAEIRRQFNQSRIKKMLKKLSRGKLYDWDKPFREHENGIDIPSRAGDAIIWDMRMVHRASPRLRKVPQPGPDSDKVAIFLTCGANNAITTEAYMNYVLSLPENQHLQHLRAGSGKPTSASQAFILR